MPLKLGFHTKYILNPRIMHINPVKVLLMAFAILFKIRSAYCEELILTQSLIATGTDTNTGLSNYEGVPGSS